MRRQLYTWLLALLIPAFAVQVALSTPIEEHGFDVAAFHIYRGVVFSQARADGWLYPRWADSINAGLGGPLFNFYSPLAYYFMDTIHAVGIPHTIAWRVLIAASLIAASAGMYLLGLLLFNRADIALVSAACFTYAPYLLRDLFERGSPQGVGIAFYPWVLWSLLRLVQRPSGLRFAIAALCWSALLLMHNLSALLLLPVVGILLVILFPTSFLETQSALTPTPRPVGEGLNVSTSSLSPNSERGNASLKRRGEVNRIKRLLLPLAALACGTLLASFHVLPFLFDAGDASLALSTREASLQPVSYPVQLSDLFASPPVFDTGIDNNSTGASIGPLHVLAILSGLVTIIILWQRSRRADSALVGLLCAFALLMIWMQTDSATFVWKALPQLAILQFRVRLLSTIGLIAAITLGYILQCWPEHTARWRSAMIMLLIAGFIALQLPSLYPQLLHRYTAFSPAPTVAEGQAWATASHTPGFTLTTVGEFLPRWRTDRFGDDDVPRIAASPIDNPPNGAQVLDYARRTGNIQVRLNTPKAFEAAFHVLYFPGWVGDVNSQPQSLQPMQGTGYILMSLPAGTDTITLHYDGTLAQHLGDLISPVMAVVLLVLPFVWRRKVVLPSVYTYRQSRWWVVVVLIFLVMLKGYWLDPQTTFFRRSSTCDAIQEGVVQADVQFGNMRLCGYSIANSNPDPGDVFRVTLYWQIDQPMSDTYSFVHLLGQSFNPETNNPLWGQQDKQTPGTLPTSLWLTGKLYQDMYDFRVPPNTPAGNYQLEIGWTDPSGNRILPEIKRSTDVLSVSDLKALLISNIVVR
jgi:hypothetical protein